jgi:hypothetical protein
MSISHWGFFPGYWQVGEPLVPRLGLSYAVWEPCDIETMVQWA